MTHYQSRYAPGGDLHAIYYPHHDEVRHKSNEIIDDFGIPLYVLCVLTVLPSAYIVDTVLLAFTAVITPFVVLLRIFQFFVITIKKKLEDVDYKKKCDYLKCSDSAQSRGQGLRDE